MKLAMLLVSAIFAFAGCSSKGSPGQEGTLGPKGEPGSVGPAGPSGPQGLAGAAGATGPQGPVGPQGAQGPAGASGAAGPAGAGGPQGPAGVPGVKGLTWRGDWAGASAYAVDDAVSHGGSAWIAVAPSRGVAPPSLDWQLLASAGAQGIQGVAGANGTQGPQGLQGPQGVAGVDGPQGPAGPQGLGGAQGPAGATGTQGPPGPAGGPLLQVIDGSGASLGPAYGFEGTFAITREVIGGGGPYFVLRYVEDAASFETDLFFASADCTGATAWTQHVGLDAFRNGTSFYGRVAGTRNNAVAVGSRRAPDGSCLVEAATIAASRAQLLGLYTAPVGPLDVVPQ